jgi:flagellar hook-associated protein 3 FlgL
MRVTASSFSTTLKYQLTELATKQARLQIQAATGQRFKLASEDPRATRKVLDLQTEIKTLTQYQKNIATLRDTQDASYNVIRSLKQLSDRANEIATLADGTRTPDQFQAYSNEINQMLEQAVQFANSRHQSSYIFGGTKNLEPPFTANKDADGNITSVTYQGSQTVPKTEIAEGINLSANVPGVNTSENGPRGLISDSRTGADFFNHLISLRDNLKAGHHQTVNEVDLPNLLKDEENFIFHFGAVGAVQTRLETAAMLANRRNASLETLISREADADLANTLVSLNEIQNAYAAALKTGGTILGQSLLDYIR